MAPLNSSPRNRYSSFDLDNHNIIKIFLVANACTRIKSYGFMYSVILTTIFPTRRSIFVEPAPMSIFFRICSTSGLTVVDSALPKNIAFCYYCNNKAILQRYQPWLNVSFNSLLRAYTMLLSTLNSDALPDTPGLIIAEWKLLTGYPKRLACYLS